MIKLFTVFFACLLLFFSCQKQAGEENKPLIVGMELEYPPFETTDKNGTPTGFSVDLAYALGEVLGSPIEIKNIRFSGLIPAIQTNKIDMIISSMSSDEQREKQIDFSRPYSFFHMTYLAGINTSIESPEDLNSSEVTIAVKSGTISQTMASLWYPDAKLKVMDQAPLAILEVVQGRSDAFVYDILAVATGNLKYPETTKSSFKSIPNSEAPISIGFNKKNKELQAKVDVALVQLLEDGSVDRILEKYLGKEKKLFEERGLPFLTE